MQQRDVVKQAQLEIDDDDDDDMLEIDDDDMLCLSPPSAATGSPLGTTREQWSTISLSIPVAQQDEHADNSR
jgi:hypothetical protein